MPYQALHKIDGIKGNRFKNRSGDQGIDTSFTIASTFGLGGPELKVTMILSNPPENTFYVKHVLRRGEDPARIHAVRNARGALTQAMDHGGTAAEKRRAAMRYSASQNAMFLTTAGTSTFICLDRLALELVLFRIAKRLAEVADRIPGDGTNRDVEIPLETPCVIDFPGNGRYSDSIILGVRKLGSDGHRMTFDINHCANGSEDYI